MTKTNQLKVVSSRLEPRRASSKAPTPRKKAALTVVSDEPTTDVKRFGDAEVLGSVPEGELASFLQQPFTFMTGNLFLDKKHRSTQDGEWKRVEMPLIQWIQGGDGWGLSRHPVGKAKDGKAIVPSENIDGARKDSAVKTMHAICIDVDSGTSLDHVKARLVEANLFAIIYTTFNHRTEKLVLKHDDVMRKLSLTETPDLAQVKDYLTRYHDTRFSADFIEAVEIVEARQHTKDGLRIVLKVPPIDKFRVVFPLAEAVELADLAATLAGWKDIWADAVTGVSVNILDSDFDSSSCDVNRLFYTPRHAKDAEWYSAVVLGKPLRFEDIQPYSKDKFLRQRGAKGDPFLVGDTGGASGEVEKFYAPSGMCLNDWHHRAKGRFMIADVLETFCSDKTRTAGGERAGTVHVECVFEHTHSSSGGTATMAMNPDANEKEVWTVFCKHDSCRGKHKLEFLQTMLAEGWFDESFLADPDFLLPPDEDDAPTVLTADAVQSHVAATFNEDSSDADVKAYLKSLIDQNADTSTLNRAKDALVSATALGARDLNAMVKAIGVEGAKVAKAKSKGIDVGMGYNEVIDATVAKIIEENAKAPLLFSYMEQLAEVRNINGARIRTLTYDGLTELLSRFVTFEKTVKMGEELVPVSVEPPLGPVKNIAHQQHDAFALPLNGVVTAPFFASDGTMIDQPGYHAGSQVYYFPPDGFALAPVTAQPSQEEVAEALRLLVEEVLADFPFGGFTREEIVARCAPGGEGVPAVAHAIGMVLLFFMRDMIHGPTPLHLFNKPAAGTGASLLSSVCHIIGTGDPVTSQSMPAKKDELAQTISASLVDGSAMIMFDNVNHAVDSAELANALTSDTYAARILGKTQMVRTKVRTIFALTANHLELSGELTRRSVLIDMDAHHADPASRTGWRHDNIRAWTAQNRPALVHACLTLIQNWIAKAQPAYAGQAVLGSYEEYVKTIGGVLEACGLGGFLGNAGTLKEAVRDEQASALEMFIGELASKPNGTRFRSGSGKDGCVSLKDVLNAGCDETDGEPIYIKDWGFNYKENMYVGAGTIGAKFGKVVAKKPWRIVCAGREVEIKFEAVENTTTGTTVYVMHKALV